MLKNTVFKLDKYTFNKQFNLIVVITKLIEDCLSRLSNNNDLKMFKNICVYLNQFLLRLNCYFLGLSNDMKQNFNYLVEFFVLNGLGIYLKLDKICLKYEIDYEKFIEPISICSNLLLMHEYTNFKFKNSQNNQLVC